MKEAIHKFFWAESLAIIGVSESMDNLAKITLFNLLKYGYKGRIYLVGRGGGEIMKHKIHTSLFDFDDVPDLATILVPARLVPKFVEDCAKKGIKCVVIQTGGFGELDEKGKRIEETVKELAEKYGVRIVGPNCLGTINTEIGLFTPFSWTDERDIRRGNVAIITQSGGVGLTIINMLGGEGIGISKFVSFGNKIDLNENDFLEYFAEDPLTGVIVLYLESIALGRRFYELVKVCEKPVILYMANITDVGRRIAFSHTEALSSDFFVLKSAMEQAGGVLVSSFSELVEAVKGFLLKPVRGKKIAILSRSGGHAVLAADAVEREGFELPLYSEAFIEKFGEVSRAGVINPTNPLDLGDVFEFDDHIDLIELAFKEEKWPEAIFYLNVFSSYHEAQNTKIALERIKDISERYGKPVYMSIFTSGFYIDEIKRKGIIPIFTDIKQTLEVMRLSLNFTKRKEEIKKEIREDMKDEMVERGELAVKFSGKRALFAEGFEILSAYGIKCAPWRVVDNPREAQKFAEEIGYPVALKFLSERVPHKTREGAVKLGIREAKEFKRAFDEMIEKFGNGEFLVQKMVSGREFFVGGRRDPSFGEFLVVGTGGVFLEALKDVKGMLLPASKSYILKMIKNLNVPPEDPEGYAKVAFRVASLLLDFPEIKEIDINPIMGGFAVDVRVLLYSR